MVCLPIMLTRELLGVPPWSNRLLIGGRMRQVMAPLAAGVQERQPQLLSLEAFGEKLSAGMVCAVRVVRGDLWIEGPYWLIKLCGVWVDVGCTF